MENFSAGTLKLEVRESAPGPIQLLWSGRSTDRDPVKLFGAYLSEVVALAESRKVAVELHFERLEYFNSSTITAILKTLHEAKQRHVKLVLVFDAAVKWQAVNFASMSQLFRDDNFLELRPLAAGK